MKRDADGIETGFSDEVDVGLSDVSVAPGAPELIGGFGSGEFAEEGVDFPLRRGTVLEAEHVAFGEEPVAQIDAPEQDGLAIYAKDFLALGAGERGLGVRRERQGGKGHG